MGKNVLLWSVPLAIAGLALLYQAIVRLVRAIREAQLSKVALQAVSLLTFEEAGNVQMHIEGPRFSRTFAGLHYEIIEAGSDTRRSLPISRMVIATRSSGFDTARELYGQVFIPTPGRYELHVRGIGNQQDRAQCHIVFTRPYTLVMVLCILGIVFSGLAIIGGIIGTALFFVLGGK